MPEYTVQRLKDRFAIVWRENGKRRRIRLASRDRASAEAEARIRWKTSGGSSWAVGRLMNGYLATITEKPSYQRRKDAWKAMQSFWNDVEPELIDEQMCRDYRKSRRVSDATARYELLQVSTALKWGRAERHIGVKPAMWLPSPPDRKIRHLTRDQFARFCAAIIAPHARTYAMIGLHTMARPSAILDLTWDRVDFMRGQIDFRKGAQTNKRRTIVPMNGELLEAMQEAYKGRTCEYVIERGGGRVKSVKKAFQAASKRSTVHATPYTLRHTGAVWAAEAGVQMSELAQFMGHDDDRTTQKHYARYSPDYLRNVADSISGGSR